MTRPDGAEDSSGRRIGRRAVLGALGLGAAGVVFGSRISSFVDDVLAPLTDHDPTGLTSYLPGAVGSASTRWSDPSPIGPPPTTACGWTGWSTTRSRSPGTSCG